MEDAEGEQLSLTEEYPTNDHFKVDGTNEGMESLGCYGNIYIYEYIGDNQKLPSNKN